MILCNSQSAPTNRDRRYDFLLFIGRVPPGCLPDLYIYEAPCAATVSYALFLFLQVGKRGIEPPMFTTWELIYSQPQHRQSLPLPHNRHKTVSNMFYVLCVTLSGLQPFTRNSLFDSSGTVGQMPEPPIDCCRNRSSAKLPVRCHLNHTVLCLIPLSAVNTTGRSRTALNRIVLVAKGEPNT